MIPIIVADPGMKMLLERMLTVRLLSVQEL